jgi:hypothetical protein
MPCSLAALAGPDAGQRHTEISFAQAPHVGTAMRSPGATGSAAPVAGPGAVGVPGSVPALLHGLIVRF